MGKLQHRKIDALTAGLVADWWHAAWPRVREQFDPNITASGLIGAFLFLAGRVLYGVRLVVSMALLWLRGLVLLVAHGVAALCMAAFLVLVVVRGIGAGSLDGVVSQYWPLLAMSFAMFAAGWLYDLALLAIAPGDSDLILFQ